MRPILLVDVDGVINVFGGTIDDDPDGVGGDALDAAFTFQGYSIRVPRGTRERFERLGSAFDCVWATTWEEDASDVFGTRLGIGAEWPHVRFRSPGLTATFKLADVDRWCDEHARGRPVAWVDDDLAWDAEEWAEHRGTTLLVRTEPDRGLTEAHVEELLAWAEASGPATV